MRLSFFKTTGSLLLAGLIMPAGTLLAQDRYQPPAVTSSTANWYDVEQASDLVNQIQNLALKVRREVARLQVQGDELAWQIHSSRLATAKRDINTIGEKLVQLDQMKSRIEPWQQNLVSKITPRIHALVYQMGAALNTLNTHQDRTVLSLTQYPQNIDVLYKSANRLASTIGTVTQYAHAEEEMGELNMTNGPEAGS